MTTNRPSSLQHRVSSFAYSSVDKTLGSASYLAEKADHVVATRSHDPTDKLYSPVARAIEALRAQIKRGSPIDISPQSLEAIIDALTKDGAIDDRLMLLEHLLVAQARLPPKSHLAQVLQKKTASMLFKDLAHPPSTLLGRAHRFRSADGSGNSIWQPEMGKARTPYARSVPRVHPMPINHLPDPGLVFDALLKRDNQDEHPAGLSAFFFAFANLVIHEIFNTDPNSKDGINNTSSYIDLSIIYGNNIAEQMQVRQVDGRGRLYPDTFSDIRLTRMAPATPALLVLFTRNHNYIASRLLEINEKGSWTKDLDSLSGEQLTAQDDEIFNTTRLIMCGFFMSIILSDYLAGILGTVREGNSWSLRLLDSVRDDDNSLSPRGEGNVLSIEFVGLYRFHATISKTDEKWVEDTFDHLFDKKPWDQITIEDYHNSLGQLRQRLTASQKPPSQYTFANLTRQPDGYFKDDDLARILQDATDEPAGAFGARRTPHAMRVIEMIGIQQQRDWGTCSMNEFRKFLGLKTFETFEEWNPDKEIAAAAQRLYGHPDNLELYVGLQAEAAKPAVDGAGLCSGYTVSRALLSDATALTRGDRFLTTDLNAFNLTAWGMAECTRDPENSSFGGHFGKVLMRALPNHYTPDSVWTNFPMVTPENMRTFLDHPRVGKADQYTYDRPTKRAVPTPIKTYAGAKAALGSAALSTSYAANSESVMPGGGYLSSFNNQTENATHKALISEAFTPKEDVVQQAQFLKDTTLKLIQRKSYTLVGNAQRSVDIVGDVINLLPIHFVTSMVLRVPLKTEEHNIGFYYEEEMRDMMEEIYNFIFLDTLEPSTTVAKRQRAKEYVDELHRQVERSLSSGILSNIAETVYGYVTGNTFAKHDWLHRLHASKRPSHELANDALSLGVILSMELAEAITHVVDALLQSDVKAEVVKLAQAADAGGSAQLKTYISEALRLTPTVGGVYRTVSTGVKLDNVQYAAGDRVFISLTDANRDPAAKFASPGRVQANSDPILHGDGIARLLGESWLLDMIAPVVTTIFSLKGLARGPGNSGHLQSSEVEICGTKQRSFFNKKLAPTPWASSLTVTYTA